MKAFDLYNDKHKLIKSGDTLIVGVSGGVDSMVLLDMLIRRQDQMNLTIVAVHINHMLRGDNADKDEQLVVSYCEDHDIKVFTFHEDVEALAKTRKNGFEEAGRTIRYQRFFEVMEEYTNGKVVLAHHLDDGIETFFLKLFRGTGLNGLASIEPKRDDGVIRPLLWMSKNEIYDYASVNGIPFNEDVTNSDSSYERNRIRNELLPFIEENIRRGALDGVAKSIELARKEREYVKGICHQIIEENAIEAFGGYFVGDSWFSTQHEAMQYRVFYQLILRLLGEEKGINEDKVLQSLSLSKTGSKVIFDDVVFVERSSNGWYFYHRSNLKAENYIIASSGVGEYQYKYWGDISQLKIRGPIEGDKVLIKGMSNYKKLNRVLIDAKIPQYQRPYISLLVDEQQIVAIIGLRQCQPIHEVSINEMKPVIVTVVSAT